MIQAEDFCKKLVENGSDLICGVPDSILKMFTTKIDQYFANHIVSANEGNAIAIAAGYYLSTRKIGIVYLQNSGIGNCINPLISLVGKDVYEIPILLIIGWRGEPGVQDEPQHKAQGLITLKLLETMEIEYKIVESLDDIDYAYSKMKKENRVYALVIKRNLFAKNKIEIKENGYLIKREDAIKNIVSKLSDKYRIISTTGMISRELYEFREEQNMYGHKYDFLTVGSMGHASSIALGVSLGAPDKEIIILDGDGACLMHMGAIPVCANSGTNNIKHIVLNNASHDSVGGQPTVGDKISFSKIAYSSGYKNIYEICSWEIFEEVLKEFLAVKGNAFLEIKVAKGNRDNLSRPKESPVENKLMFIENLCNE